MSKVCDWNDEPNFVCWEAAKYEIQCTGKYCATHQCSDTLVVCEEHLALLMDYEVNEFPHYVSATYESRGDAYVPDVMRVTRILQATLVA